jgi:uncharacterized membrane protein YozB (DUF420 family)
LGRNLYWFLSFVTVAIAFRWLWGGVGAAIPSVANHLDDRAVALYLHMVGSAVPMALIPFQLSNRFRAAHPQVHRVMGWCAIAGAYLGGVSLMPLAVGIDIPVWGRSGFVLAGLLWLCCVSAGLYFILRRDLRLHRWWMMVTATVIFGAVTQRLVLPLFIGVGFDHRTAYSLTPYTAFTFNLIVFFAWQYRRSLARLLPGRAA